MKRKYTLAVSLCLALALMAGCDTKPANETTAPSSATVDPTEQTKETKPKETKPKETKPKETKPQETEPKETKETTEAPTETPTEASEEPILGMELAGTFWSDGDLGFYFEPDGVSGQSYSGEYVVDDGTYEWDGTAGRFTTSHTYIYAIRLDSQGNLEVTDEMGEVSILSHQMSLPNDVGPLNDNDLALLQSHPWYTADLRLEFLPDGICVVEGLSNGSYQEASYTFDDLWDGGVIATDDYVMDYSFVNGVLTVDGEICYESLN